MTDRPDDRRPDDPFRPDDGQWRPVEPADRGRRAIPAQPVPAAEPADARVRPVRAAGPLRVPAAALWAAGPVRHAGACLRRSRLPTAGVRAAVRRACARRRSTAARRWLVTHAVAHRRGRRTDPGGRAGGRLLPDQPVGLVRRHRRGWCEFVGGARTVDRQPVPDVRRSVHPAGRRTAERVGRAGSGALPAERQRSGARRDVRVGSTLKVSPTLITPPWSVAADVASDPSLTAVVLSGSVTCTISRDGRVLTTSTSSTGLLRCAAPAG